MSIKSQIAYNKLPQHIAFIMDGNGRWAQGKGKCRQEGHESGVISLKDIVDGALEIGLKYVTFYAFSSENWSRPQSEVDALMELLVATIKAETASLQEKNIRLNAIGNLSSLPVNCYNNLQELMQKTESNTACTLTLALSYSSKNEIVNAVRSIVQQVQEGELLVNHINEDVLTQALYTHDMPDPELMIRTSGECRISNFLLWQMAYTEFYFSPKFWPEFMKEDLFEAIVAYQQRERRFGKTSDQVQNQI